MSFCLRGLTSPVNLSTHFQWPDSQSTSESREESRRDWLGEDVGDLIVGWNVSHLERPILNLLANKKEIKLHMLGPSILNWVCREKNSAEIVDPDYGALAGGNS